MAIASTTDLPSNILGVQSLSSQFDEAHTLVQMGDLEGARQVLVKLCYDHPTDALLNYRCASIHDNLGMEADARPYYERAIRLGLQGENLEGAFLGLGSTYRCIGEYAKSIEVLIEGSRQFPHNLAMKVFEAMALHESGKHNLATALLLHCLVEKPGDESIARYSKAIQYYSQQYAGTPSD
jgi:tetratricopeptide (TPR) repeat protein